MTQTTAQHARALEARIRHLEDRFDLLDDMVGYILQTIQVDVALTGSPLDIAPKQARMRLLDAYVRFGSHTDPAGAAPTRESASRP